MAYIVIKRGKFLKSSNYCTGFPVQYFWTHDEAEARRYSDDQKAFAEQAARETNGKMEKRVNTKLELRVLGKARIREREARKALEDDLKYEQPNRLS